MAEITYAEPTTQVIPDIDFSPTTSGTITPVDFSSGNSLGNSSVGLDGRSTTSSPSSYSPDIIDAEWRNVTPEPFESTSEWSARQRELWRREDSERIDQARRESEAYDQAIRDIDAGLPQRRGTNPNVVNRAAGATAGALSGVSEAMNRRANGAGWGETIGAGIGSAAGGLTGGIGGAKAGAAAGTVGATPGTGTAIGIGVGGVIGEAVGSALGAEIGAGLGRAIDNLFPGQDGEESGADNLSPVEGDAPVDPSTADGSEPFDARGIGGVRIELTRPWGAVDSFAVLEFGPSPDPRPNMLYLITCNGRYYPVEPYSSFSVVESGSCGAPTQEPQTRPKPTAPTFPDAPAFEIPDFDLPGLPDLFGDRPPTNEPADRPRFQPIGAPDTSVPQFPEFPNAEPEPAPQPQPQPTDEPLGDIPGSDPTTGSPSDTFSGNPTTAPDPITRNPQNPTDFPSTGEDLEPINESPDSDLNENEQPKECDPCQKIDELTAFVQQALKDPDVLLATLQGCEEQEEPGKNFFSAGGRGLGILSSNQKVLIDLLNEVWEKVKCESDSYASIPDSATFKVPNIVPQLSLQFKESGNNKGSRWHITIPRFNEAFKDNLEPFTYQKGNYRCGLELTDNSKIIVNAVTEDEGRRVIAHCRQFVLPEYLTPLDWIKVNKIPSRQFKEVTVVSCHAKYFTGRLDEPPKWVRKIK